VEDHEAALEDGEHDAFVVDASDVARPDGTTGTRLELTLTTGPGKGRVVTVESSVHLGDELDLLGMPATLTVSAGVPSVRIDR
jgi:hypothetical protein